MKTLTLKRATWTAGIALLRALPGAAQITIAPLPHLEGSTPGNRVQQIRLRYVRPSVMAWWLDSKNHAAPPTLMPNASALSPQPRWKLHLPDGVDSLVAVDSQNTLLVFGTDAGFEKLRQTIQFLDRPEDGIPLRAIPDQQITLDARLLTIKTDNLSGIWAALSTQTGRATSAITILKPDEHFELSEQIARREARFESTKSLLAASGTTRILDFGPAASNRSNRSMFEDFRSDMPVISPPETGDMKNLGAGKTGRLLPAPLGNLRMLIKPTLGTDNSVSLELRELGNGGILGREKSAKIEIHAGETLVCALPTSTPGTRAFLLISATKNSVMTGNKIPLLGDLPDIGGLFRRPKTSENSPAITQ